MDNTVKPGWMNRVASASRAFFWTLLVLMLLLFILLQFFGSRATESACNDRLKGLEQDRKSRVIALIHRQENVTVLGMPVSSYISIEDSEAVVSCLLVNDAVKVVMIKRFVPAAVT